MAFTQDNRRLRIATPLGPNDLLALEFRGHEGMSELFSFEVDLLSEKPDISFDDVVGKNVTVSVLMKAEPGEDSEARYFNGIVSRFSQGASRFDCTAYTMHIVPWLWFLTRTADCRIFQKQSVREIIKKIFGEYGFADFADRLQGDYQPRDYCVQYRETDFNFLSRLMEEEGIYYFFEHENGKHTLVLGDSASTHKPCPLLSKTKYVYSSAGDDVDEIGGFEKLQEVRPAKFAVTDYNFETPSVDLGASADGKDSYGYEVYDYPGEYVKRAEGERLARVRQEEEDASRVRFQGHGFCRAFTPGYKFDLAEHPSKPFNSSYLLTSVQHEATESYGAGNGAGPVLSYENVFDCIPATIPFRPARVTPRPVVQGAQTAIVVGPSGEEIFTDKYGRVKVKFHWDREGKGDENSSCWVRVSQGWANKRWGAIFIPRIGQEVIVDFLEGDPDQPIITGGVYNADTMPPYALPDEQTKSTIKTMSSKGGGGFNEIRFEDKKGDEQIFIHGEKNQDIRLKNDLYEWIGNDSHLIVKKDQIESIENDRHLKVGNDDVAEIGKDHHLKVKGKQAIEIADSHSFTVKGDVIEVFQGNHSSQVTQNLYLKAMGLVIEASTGITIKCGGNAVVIDPVGVTLKGTMLTLDGNMVMIASGPGSSAQSGSAGSAVSPTAPKEPHEADEADPGKMAEVKAKQVETKSGKYGAAKVKPYKKDPNKKSWIEIELVDEDGKPVPGERYEVTLPDGQTVASGTLDQKGFARIDGIDAGSCKVTFPDLDKKSWEKA